MKNKINLNKEISIDIPKLIEGGMVILANSGGGKSYAIRKIAEEAVTQVQVIILDPEGEFASLREKYDFILAGKNADVPVEVRSASLLATKLLELGKSAVIDLYELHPSERQRYVKLFCEAMVNCPKELYHPVLVILDEAHEYVPEGKPSEATWAVESLASKGRKRGQRLILASQRISKLSKNASAECNNKLIGRASQDIDMKRAGDELGFNKESLKDLRQLKPGEFFAFGPAISDEVLKIKIGEVQTAHAKVGYKNANKVPPASHVIKQVLGALADLPQEAEKEAKTIAEFKKQINELQKHKCPATFSSGPSPEEVAALVAGEVKEALKKQEIEFWKERDEWLKQIQNWFSILKGIGESMQEFQKNNTKINVYKNDYARIKDLKIPKGTPLPKFIPYGTETVRVGIDWGEKGGDKTVILKREGDTISEIKPLSKCATNILSYLHGVYPIGKTKSQVWIATLYSPSGSFNTALSELINNGYIISTPKGYGSTGNYDISLVEVPYDSSLERWFQKLSLCAQKILKLLLQNPNLIMTKQELLTDTGYAPSGSFNTALSELLTPKLIEKERNGYIINPEILNL